MIRKVVTPKGKTVGTIGVYGRTVAVVWSTGEMMVFRGKATIVFHQNRQEVHVDVDNGKITTVCDLVNTVESPKVKSCPADDITIGNGRLVCFVGQSGESIVRSLA